MSRYRHTLGKPSGCCRREVVIRQSAPDLARIAEVGPIRCDFAGQGLAKV
jgi:hypothetical protein